MSDCRRGKTYERKAEGKKFEAPRRASRSIANKWVGGSGRDMGSVCHFTLAFPQATVRTTRAGQPLDAFLASRNGGERRDEEMKRPGNRSETVLTDLTSANGNHNAKEGGKKKEWGASERQRSKELGEMYRSRRKTGGVTAVHGAFSCPYLGTSGF